MTYYEWVELFDEIKKSPRNQKYIDILKTKKVNYTGNIETLFSNHIVEIINERLKRIIVDFINKTKTARFDINTLGIEINEVKKEIKYLNDIISLDIVPENKRKNMKRYLMNYAKKVESSIKESFNNVTNAEVLTMINNMNLSLEDNNELQ